MNGNTGVVSHDEAAFAVDALEKTIEGARCRQEGRASARSRTPQWCDDSAVKYVPWLRQCNARRAGIKRFEYDQSVRSPFELIVGKADECGLVFGNLRNALTKPVG